MHSAVELGVSVRFVARVDHRAGPRGGRRDGVPHLVRALRETVGGGPVLGTADVSGPRDDLARDEVGQRGRDPGAVVGAPAHEVVLMAPERVARGVEVVLEQVDASAHALGGQARVGLSGH